MTRQRCTPLHTPTRVQIATIVAPTTSGQRDVSTSIHRTLEHGAAAAVSLRVPTSTRAGAGGGGPFSRPDVHPSGARAAARSRFFVPTSTRAERGRRRGIVGARSPSRGSPAVLPKGHRRAEARRDRRNLLRHVAYPVEQGCDHSRHVGPLSNASSIAIELRRAIATVSIAAGGEPTATCSEPQRRGERPERGGVAGAREKRRHDRRMEKVEECRFAGV